MNHRERVHASLKRLPLDRVPFMYRDEPEVERRLCRDCGLPDREALLRHLDIDFRMVAPRYIGPQLDGPGPDRRRDIWGVEYKFVNFSDNAGYWEVADNPLAACDDPVALKDYPWPRMAWFDFDSLKRQAADYREYALMTAPGFASPSILQTPVQSLIGMERSLSDMLLNPSFIEALLEQVMAFELPFIDRMLSSAGGAIDIFRLGDDYGTQNGLLFGPAEWRHFVLPRMQAIAAIVRRHGARFYLHSCGGVRDLLPLFIEAGVEILDPIQVKAAGMDPGELKREFGDRLAFSGGVDEQELLRKGTTDEVRRAVRDLLLIMAPGGGYFIGPTHNFQDDIPTANILAMYEAAGSWTQP